MTIQDVPLYFKGAIRVFIVSSQIIEPFLKTLLNKIILVLVGYLQIRRGSVELKNSSHALSNQGMICRLELTIYG